MIRAMTLPPVRVVLQPCPCGGDTLADGWRAQGRVVVHFVHCCDCGEWIEGETEERAAAAWNAAARKARDAGQPWQRRGLAAVYYLVQPGAVLRAFPAPVGALWCWTVTYEGGGIDGGSAQSLTKAKTEALAAYDRQAAA